MERESLTCSACGRESPAGMRFCGFCANPLPPSCPACGRANPPGMRFCGYCATPLQAEADTPAVAQPAAPPSPAPVEAGQESRPETASAAPGEERRLVTTLFCDLVGFTPMAERLDPEEVRDIQARYFAEMRGQVERFGGTIEKYAGDAILALFGVPIAHEDDAERAVLCALGMQTAIQPVAEEARIRWGLEPSIRVGVNTGEVVSGVWEVGGRRDVTVTGDAVNTAARIQAAAEAGEVLAGAETMRLTRRRIQYGEKRDLVLKGKTGTIPVYPALRSRERPGERWEMDQRVTPLVGRDREMVELLEIWMRAQGGEGQLVTVMGEPGVGKSRLIAEAVARVMENTAVRLIRARSLSYSQEVSLWLIADLVRSLVGIHEQEPAEDVRIKLRTALVGFLGDANAGALADATDVVGEVLGLPAGGSMLTNAGAQARRQALVRSLRLILGGLSQRAPTIVVLEDLHWIDSASGDILREIASDVPGLRLLILASQRPGWAAPWSEWGWTERITLRPLREEDAMRLAGAVLGGTRLSEHLEHYVAERAGGNPFFVEEMLRTLEETGAIVQRSGQAYLTPGSADLLPSTLTEVLLARLDRLDPDVRTTAQVASVIGRSFAVQLLARVMGREPALLEGALTALQQAEIAFPRRGQDPEYVFRHVSMQEVAYNTLVQRRRQELHLQTARAIAALYPSDEFTEMVAYHYGKTGEDEEAAVWLERAGDRAAAIYAMESAIGHYRAALHRLDRAHASPQSVAAMYEKLGAALYTIGTYNETLELLELAVEIYRQDHDLEAAGRVTAAMGRTHRYRGSHEEGIPLVQAMIERLEWRGPSPALGLLYLALANLLLTSGRYHELLAAAERAAEIARAIGDDAILGEAEERRGTGLTVLGRGVEGRQALEKALTLLEGTGDLTPFFRALNNLGEACKQSGELEEARKYTERALEVAERLGNPEQTSFVLANLGHLLALTGAWVEAEAVFHRSEIVREQRGVAASGLGCFSYLGWLSLWEGNWDRAADLLERGITLAREAHDRQALDETQVALSELDILQGRPSEAIDRLTPLLGEGDSDVGVILPTLAWAHLENDDLLEANRYASEAVARARSVRSLRLIDALWVQGMIWAREGRWEDAERTLTEAQNLARTAPYPYAMARTLVVRGEVAGKQGNRDEAHRRLHEALILFRDLGARKDVEATEEKIAELGVEHPQPLSRARERGEAT